MSENVREVKLLSEQRFDSEANKVYKVPVDKLPKRSMLEVETENVVEVIDFEAETTLSVILEFVKHHKKKQVPRLKELERYAKGDNNIKYREAKGGNRADNRIATPWAKFINDFKRGVLLSNPLKYTGDNKVIKLIEEITARVNDDLHNNMMAADALDYGRAYELVGRDENAQEYYVKMPADEVFVVYESSHKKSSIAGVHYYDINFLGETTHHIDVYANDGFTYHWEMKDTESEYKLPEDNGRVPNYFNAVQINEWMINNERLSDTELIMDSIDAYDLSQSEMANYMQDLSESILWISGNPDTFKKEDGSIDTEGLDYTIKNRIMIGGDPKEYETADGKVVMGPEPKASYLTKTYDSTGTEAYNDRLVSDMLRFTSLIDFTDDNMGGNQTGVGLRFKGWGSDNDRMNKERMIQKAIMRRLRLLVHSWSIKENLNTSKGLVDSIKSILMPGSEQQKRENDLYELVNQIQIKFTPNIPQSDEEIMNVITGMDLVISKQSILEMASRLTGVSPEEELKRLNKEADKEKNPPQYDYETNNRQPINEEVSDGQADE